MNGTFAEIFCRRLGIGLARYADAMLLRCLYPWAVPLLPVIRLVAPDYFASDLRLVHAVGRLASPRGLAGELAVFRRDPEQRNFLRRRLRLRISSRRVARLVVRTWREHRRDGPADKTPGSGGEAVDAVG